MKRVLYHGSEKIIEHPVFGYGNRHNDYGLGFYCTPDKQLAKEWAKRKNNDGFVNVYTIRDDRFHILDLTDNQHDVLHWIALLMSNRFIEKEVEKMYPRELDYLFQNYLIDITPYDVIIGYRADDAYFRFPESFIRGDLTVETLKEIYQLGDLGKQYVLISERAFKNIHFESFIEAKQEDYQAYYARKEKADKRYVELLERDRYSTDTRLKDLVMKND